MRKNHWVCTLCITVMAVTALPAAEGEGAAVPAAEGYSILLSNPEESDLHYVVVSESIAGVRDTNPLLGEKARAFFSGTSPEVQFSRVPAGSLDRIEDLEEGRYLLIGFFASPGDGGFPVRVMSVTAGEGVEQRLYSVYARPAVITVKPGEGRLADFSSSTDVAESDPVESGEPQGEGAAEPSAGHEPRTFSREMGGKVRVLPIEASIFWGEGGLRVTDIRIARGPLRVCYTISTAEPMRSDQSIFLYFHDQTTAPRSNDVTLELIPSGYAVLWRSDEARPHVAGRLTLVGSQILGCIAYADVPEAVYGLFGSGAIVDIATVRMDASMGLYEEFFVATLEVGDFPLVDDAGSVLLR